MNDFASAAMVRLLVQGMRRLGLPVCARWQAEHAHVGLGLKREVVQAAVAAAGPAVLLELPQALHDVGFDPTLAMLCAQPEPAAMMARWQRLERYVHSRHRTLVQRADAGGIQATHVSLHASARPEPGEDLVVLGLLVALCQRCGAREVRAFLPGGQVYPAVPGLPARVRQACASGATADWRLQWTRWEPPSRLCAQDARRPDLPDELRERPVAAAVMRHMLADVTRRWRIDELAGALGCSARTLQRRLAAEGSRFDILLAQARLRSAAAWLAGSRLSLAEIGFVSGYADQAHFTREFRRRLGMAPAAWRQAA